MMLSPSTTAHDVVPLAQCSARPSASGDAALAFLVGVVEVLEPKSLPLPSSDRKSPDLRRRSRS
jgi:hypothetical protein